MNLDGRDPIKAHSRKSLRPHLLPRPQSTVPMKVYVWSSSCVFHASLLAGFLHISCFLRSSKLYTSETWKQSIEVVQRSGFSSCSVVVVVETEHGALAWVRIGNIKSLRSASSAWCLLVRLDVRDEPEGFS